MATRSILGKAGTVGRAVIAAAVLIGYGQVAAAAENGADPMRCEALKLKCDSRYHACLSRCDRAADRRASRSGLEAEDSRRDCSAVCGERRDGCRFRFEQRTVCKGSPSNPQECAAQLLWAKSEYLSGQARCHIRADQRPEFDCDVCANEAYDDYRNEVDSITADPVCKDGPAEPVEVAAPPEACVTEN